MAVVLATVVVAGGVTAYMKVNAGINTFNSAGLSKHRPPPSVAGQNILLIGSDTRAGADRALGGAGSAVGRSDTTLLLHIYEGGERAVGVSIPRDALVDIPRCLLPDGSWSAPQHNAMFNSAFSVGQTKEGNPACTVNTVEKLTDMRIDHTVVVDFAGFAAMTEIVGGVPICVPHPIYQGDLNPNLGTRGKVIFPAGKQEVAGAKALDFVRLRHGIGDGSDIGRMSRQQAFLSALIAKVKSQGLTPTRILPLAEAATQKMTVDAELGTTKKLLSFVMSLRHMSPDNIDFLTTPWRYDGPRVALVHPDVDQLWAALRADQPLHAPKRKPASKSKEENPLQTVTDPVTVLNGTTIENLAGRTSLKLGAAGLEVSKVANAETSDYEQTVVGYGPGEEDQARALASLFDDSTLEEKPGSGLVVTLGTQHDLSGLASAMRDKVAKLPDSVTKETRRASDDPCTGVSS